MPVAHAPPRTTPDFRNIDFTKFKESLQTRLQTDSPAIHITSEQQFNTKVDKLTTAIQDTINELIPNKKPSPFSKRWWNAELTVLKKKENKPSNEAYKFRDIVDHPAPAKERHRKITKELAVAVENVSKDHWQDWLENITSQ